VLFASKTAILTNDTAATATSSSQPPPLPRPFGPVHLTGGGQKPVGDTGR
jgi:hypothetical protein